MATASIDGAMTLAALVDAHPELARELERKELDYCCGGGVSLNQACTDAGLDPDAVAEELATTLSGSARAPWSEMDALALVDHLQQRHHRYLWDEMPRISALLDKLVAVHGARHPELDEVAACFGSIRADLEPHMMKEERVLFPMIRELAASEGLPTFHCGTLRNPISVMIVEHDAVGELLARLRRLTDGYQPPADGCATYAACYRAMAELEADTHLHVHKENNVLFPLVVRMEAERAAAAR